MNTVEMPFNDLIKVYKLAALGKVIGGLIHNLNSPLQNLGLNIEMMAYSLQKDSNLDEVSAENILERLGKMEDEFDRIDRMIRGASSKANPDDSFDTLRQLDDLLHQELSFLQTNLYFKHKVQTDLNIDDNLPPIKDLPQQFLLGLCWFLQALVEDLEVCGIGRVSLNAHSDNTSISVGFNTQEKPLSETVMQYLSKEKELIKSQHQGDIDVGLWISLIIFGNCNISVNSETGPEGSKVTLSIPIQN